jgi:hypothetical protein
LIHSSSSAVVCCSCIHWINWLTQSAIISCDDWILQRMRLRCNSKHKRICRNKLTRYNPLHNYYLLNHMADSPPEPTAVVPTSPSITAAPSSDWSGVFVPSSHRGGLERIATPRHPLAAPCTYSRGFPSLCFAHQLCLLFCRALPLDSVRWHPRLHRRGPTPSTRPRGNSLHLSLRLPLPPCRRTNLHKHTTINRGLVCLYLCLFCLYLCLILICFVLFD